MQKIWIINLILGFIGTISTSSQDEYRQYTFYQKQPVNPRPLDLMADLTNDLGIRVMRAMATGDASGNIAFSPFGLMAVSVLLYEGSSGYSALQIKQSLNLPWEILAVRIGMRDLNRYLKTYFKSDGFLNGLTMSREEVCLSSQFKRILQLYSFDEPNSFLIDSCREKTTTHQSVSITTQGIAVTEIVPTSQTIQVANVTKGAASDISSIVTELPVSAEVTYVGDAGLTISIANMNTNSSIKLQTDAITIEDRTQTQTTQSEPTTNSPTTLYLSNEDELKSSNEFNIINKELYKPLATDFENIFESTFSNDPMFSETTVTQTSLDISSRALGFEVVDKSTDTTESSEIITKPIELSSYLTDILYSVIDKSNEIFSNNSITSPATVESLAKTDLKSEVDETNQDKISINNETLPDGIQNETLIVEFPKTIIENTDLLKTTSFNENEAITTENSISMTDIPVVKNGSTLVDNEILLAESNKNYHFALLERNGAKSIEDNHNLPSFDVEFVVKRDDIRLECKKLKKKVIKPDRILMQYPKNPAITIALNEPIIRSKRYLNQYQGNKNQWFTGYKSFNPMPNWGDRAYSTNPFEITNLFNAEDQRLQFFTYTAVLPFGFIYDLKSQVIEIPLDDSRYTLMILMPNHPEGLTELLLLLPTLSLRNIHNSLKPTAVHATIPAFKYISKVDLTSALQQVGIRDVFYRYRADLSFMSSDARLFVNSVQQVVSVTAKKYKTSVYEIQRKYVEHNFVISRPFVYFVIDLHTKVSLIAGVLTDPLASPL
ncbi:uncharacterized protein LOC126906190 [Daktulosphaira vitifoliae]|uniref:uncharacterized protein LOC126906190 n=1 Tax=Daktulosphaira vitifoliae TaxID=58002 RepID=UPI0021A9CCA0|nr:uncharacterized protein LOC126906190 [Daktulosphaira vitifoliae]